MNNFKIESHSIKYVVGELEKGHYGIPSFQRGIAWKEHHIVDLLESIVRGNFIGSILLLDKPLEIEFGYDTFPSLEYKKNLITSHILDGQQRLSSLYFAIVKPETQTKKGVRYFLSINKLLEEKESVIEVHDLTKKSNTDYTIQEALFKNHLFPLEKLNESHRWNKEYEDYLINPGGEIPSQARVKADKLQCKLNEIWNDFKIPFINLNSSIKLEQLANIFEKLNDTGIPLTVFDLLNARLLASNIQLRKVLWEKTNKYNYIGKYNKKPKLPVWILQNICLKRGEPIQRKYILDLKPKNFEVDWDSSLQKMERAFQLLNEFDTYGALDYDYIPYHTMVPGLAELFDKAKEDENPDKCYKKIQSWFWAICYAGSYDSGSDSKVVEDVKLTKKWFENDNDIPHYINYRKEVSSLDLLNVEGKSSALFKSIMCLIVTAGAVDFRFNQKISVLSKINIHHIFPISYAKSLDEKKKYDSVLNKTLIDSSTNQEFIGKLKPSKYIEKLKHNRPDLNDEILKKRFETHLISEGAFDCLLKDDIDGFLSERSKTIQETFKKRILTFPVNKS